jgi:hypothetical protein
MDINPLIGLRRHEFTTDEKFRIGAISHCALPILGLQLSSFYVGFSRTWHFRQREYLVNESRSRLPRESFEKALEFRPGSLHTSDLKTSDSFHIEL